MEEKKTKKNKQGKKTEEEQKEQHARKTKAEKGKKRGLQKQLIRLWGQLKSLDAQLRLNSRQTMEIATGLIPTRGEAVRTDRDRARDAQR